MYMTGSEACIATAHTLDEACIRVMAARTRDDLQIHDREAAVRYADEGRHAVRVHTRRKLAEVVRRVDIRA